ncbi:hypothetical protein GBAR_LOCUS19772, partial [Geodia barretti]
GPFCVCWTTLPSSLGVTLGIDYTRLLDSYLVVRQEEATTDKGKSTSHCKEAL